jgi:RNA polymerase sigma factor (sigma-70 family)
MKDLLLQIRVKNNALHQLIKSRMEVTGDTSLSVFFNKIEKGYHIPNKAGSLCQYAYAFLSLKDNPYKKGHSNKRLWSKGIFELRKPALTLLEALRYEGDPYEIYPPYLYDVIQNTKAEIEVSMNDFIALDSPEMLLLQAQEDPIEHTQKELDKKNLHKMLDYLSPRERAIVMMRFGLEDGQGYTLEEVGQKFGVTRDRIRQIEARVLHKLKEHPMSCKFKEAT